jgi:hypothetical protein
LYGAPGHGVTEVMGVMGGCPRSQQPRLGQPYPRG